ncbi:unnamed protein product [Paramecium sonneborni]|uniref:Uncharacterized protein n=1 Tax=Paramecium sonneborni TaxID=65129 RepID=A0A8S1QFT1_9CILI|nr:unnamed protein product [Paramecium sonneborni]
MERKFEPQVQLLQRKLQLKKQFEWVQAKRRLKGLKQQTILLAMLTQHKQLHKKEMKINLWLRLLIWLGYICQYPFEMLVSQLNHFSIYQNSTIVFSSVSQYFKTKQQTINKNQKQKGKIMLKNLVDQLSESIKN